MTTRNMTSDKLNHYLETISKDLDRSMKFWFDHSHDEEYGGFFTCLGRDGQVYDPLKYCWLQGRQIWTYAWLYNECDRFHKSEVLEKAISGADFLMRHIKKPGGTGKCYFLLTQDGKPIKVQRTIFSECFYTMAMAELARATNEDKYKEEALNMMDNIIQWMRKDDSALGREKLSGQTPSKGMAEPMMLCCLINQLQMLDSNLADKYDELAHWCIEELFAHVQRDGSFVLENISKDGKELLGSLGRLTVPGHAIECGWFLLQLAEKKSDKEMATRAIKYFVETPFQYGWDKTHGGLFYFLDADGISPTQLEWNMKLWWPHNEAMIAFLMAYKNTKNPKYLELFDQVFEYCYKHFSDDKDGEWFGYLDRRGDINMDFKGGPWKGCFHVPRCLWMCEKLLTEIMASNNGHYTQKL